MAPLIGVSTYTATVRHGRWEEVAVFTPLTYPRALSQLGAGAVLLPSTLNDADIELDAVLDRLDGLVLIGGYDVCGLAYGREETEEEHRVELHDPDRDALEISLTRLAWERRMPILAICRGLQVLNVALGGTLVRDVGEAGGSDEHRPVPGQFHEHAVQLEPGSLAHSVLGGQVDILSHHHQALDQVAGELRVSGRAADGVVEAAESADPGRWALGVQWHPEEGTDMSLFRALVEVCDAAGMVADEPGGVPSAP
jgi:putative glutamine amidotransferase